MTIGAKIKEARTRRGLTQKKLAEKSGLAEITIRQYENNKRQPGAEQLGKIATALDLGYAFTKEGEAYFYDFVDTVQNTPTKEPSYEDVETLIARNGKDFTTEQKMQLIKLLSELNDH